MHHLSDAAADDLEDAITSTTESVQYDHPNHTVTVTTISDLDLTGANLFGSATTQVNRCACIYHLSSIQSGQNRPVNGCLREK